MPNLFNTYQLIADILSFDSSNDTLKDQLTQPEMNWDTLVIESSKHVSLPALYCRLRSRKLLDVLPEELQVYLEKITSINRNRNKAILKQVDCLTQLFNTNQIDHVFLKGAALLAAGYYEDLGERMIGDIDILVAKNQVDIAFDLLIQQDYIPSAQTLGAAFFEHKHLPRLTKKKHIAAIEIHRKLFINYQHDELSNTCIISHKQRINLTAIPSPKHLAMHNILNHQINDYGRLYRSTNFRTAYDTLLILRKNTNINFQDLQKTSPIKHYFKYFKIHFNTLGQPSKRTYRYALGLYRFKLRHVKFQRFWHKLVTLYIFMSSLTTRLYMFLCNSDYRIAIFSDRKRVIHHLKSRLHLK
ncbi:nucleotidyltransferase family protein [Winogradskyella sp. UBA3174]|uniref:nucleotidyltransferase family protein n=1 Tax=Winogradskyella sp. UBA3174 TaxID=1947785 RepID=UPI0025D258D4|nr:nucleotidyltransferase family protein [Winogradskyella sp. UBA3174]|tara:strand:- start:37715 stop:38785 length:1071 start_codon:yes stop_codon:yes gene_type:complete